MLEEPLNIGLEPEQARKSLSVKVKWQPIVLTGGRQVQGSLLQLLL
jgi:hypothetical protein